MGGGGALANIKAHADRDWWPGGNPSRCLMLVGCRCKHLGAWHRCCQVLGLGAFGWGEGSYTQPNPLLLNKSFGGCALCAVVCPEQG